MSRKRYAFIAILCIVGVVTGFVVTPLILSPQLEWSVRIGDTASYAISVQGWELNASDYHQRVPTYLMAYDNMNITAVIAELPELGLYVNGEEFQRQVVFSKKVHTQFSKGSDTPVQLASVVDYVIPWSLLPTGAWGLVDWFYPDTPSSSPWYQSLYAYTGTTSFHFGLNGLDFDLTTRLRSDISFDTGSASRISYFRSHGVDNSYNINLVRIGN